MQDAKKNVPHSSLSTTSTPATSPAGTERELKLLATMLETPTPSETKASELSGSAAEDFLRNEEERRRFADAAFNYLHHNRTKLSAADLQAFAALSHRYFAKVLLSRAPIQALRAQQPTPVQVVMVDNWLKQYQDLGQSVQACLPAASWAEFCTQASDTLAAKGYLYPEQILPEVPETKTEESPTPLSANTPDRACQEYEDELYSRLTNELLAARAALAERLQETTSTGGTAASTIVSAIPVVGSVLSKAIDTGAGVITHRDNATVAAWAKTLPEIDQLSCWLARAFIDMRREQLPALKESDFSFLENAQQKWRGIREKDNFSPARKLALKDLGLVLELLPQYVPSTANTVDARVTENVATLRQAFQYYLTQAAQSKPPTLPLLERFKQIPEQIKQLPEQVKEKALQALTLSDPIKAPQDKKAEASSPTKEAKVALPPAVCLTLSRSSATANAWQFQRAAILATANSKDGTAQEQVNSESLTHLQAAGSLQQRADYAAERCATQLKRLKDTPIPAWADVVSLWNGIDAYLTLPGLSDVQQALWQQLSSVWSSQGADDINQRALRQHMSSLTAATACQELHQQIMRIIRGLSQRGQPAMATMQAQRYQASAQRALTQAEAKLSQLQAEAKETEAQNQQHQARRDEWSQQLQSWQQQLAAIRGPAATEEPTSPLSPAAMTAEMQQFAHALQETWRQDKPLDVLKTQYAGQYNLWQTQQRQGLPIAADTFKTLEVGLVQLQRLFDIEQAQSTTAPLQQEKLLATQQLCQAWETNNEEAMAQYRALTSPSTIPAQTVDQPSIELPTLKSEEKSATVNLVQRLEGELGEPPCGFAVLTASIIVKADDKQQPHAAYTTATEPQLALLITDSSLQDHPYWRAYTQLWQWHQQCQNPAQATATTVYVWIATPRTLPPHVLWATCEGNSQAAAAQATKLFAEYQQQCDAHLQATNDKQVSFTHSYGYHGLQVLFRRPLPSLPAGSRPQAIVDALLTPLQDFLLHIGLYYGVPAAALASSAKVLDVLTVQARFSTGFIADLRSALAWAEGQQARITTTAARGGPPLTPAQKRELQQHHQHTVQALWQRCQVTAERALPWSLTSGPAQYFDPLWEQFEDTRAALAQGKILLTNIVEAKHTVPQQEATLTNADRALDFLVRLIVHRQQFGWTEHQQYLFDLPPACRLPYVEKLAQALPPAQQSLVTRLRHAPLPNGRRLTQEIEQREWEKSLQSLWQPADNSVENPTVAESKSGDTTIQIVRARQVIREDGPKWELETRTLHPTIARQLFKPNGEWQDKNKQHSGNHLVHPISAGGKVQFWVKVYPEQPASEFLVTELDRRLGVEGTPHMELVKFQHGGKTSAAVITSAVSGVNLQTVVDKVPEQLQQLSLATFVSTLLRVLLTNPEDDKGDDYFLVPQADRTHKLVRIDNERAFFKPNSEQQKLLFKSEHLLVKSIIYCLEQMQWQWADDAAVAAVIEDFLHLQPVTLVSDLLQTADQLHDGWNLLFSEGEVTAHFNCKDPWASLPVMCIPNGLARELITRLTTMHTALRMEHNHMTGLQLLKVTQPKLAQYYVASHSSVSLPTQQLLLTPFRAEQKGASPAAESKRRASTGTAHETAADHTRVSARFERVAGHLYQKKNKKDSHSGQRSLMPNSVAMQSSLRLESPVDLATLKKVRHKETCSAKQQLVEFNQWQEMQRVRLPSDLMAQKDTAIAEWQGLPLRHQHLIFTQLQTKAKDNQLSVEQKHFILKALAAVVRETPWPQLDFNGFEDALTDTLLEPLLKAAGQQLLQLNVNGCSQLTDKSFKTLLAYNPHLRRLQAQQVAWTTVTLTTLTHLEELDLSGSIVQTVTGEALSLRSLQLKDCSKLQSLGEVGLVQKTPFYTSKLTQLTLNDCQRLSEICVLKELFFSAVAPQLPQANSTNLKTISLQTETGWLRVPSFLMKLIHSGATQLEFSGNNEELTSAQRKQLMNYLVHDTIFTHLNLSSNQLGEAGAQALAEILKTNTALTSLHLGYSLGEAGEAGAQALADMLKTNTILTTLNLERNLLGDSGAQALAEALRTNTTLTKLNLRGNLLGKAGVQALAEALKINTTFNQLDLGDNYLGDIGAQALAEMFKTNTALTELGLQNNKLGDGGIQALAEALKTNTAIAHLDLTYNKLGDIGTKALAEALKTNTAFTTLNLERNQLGDAGAQALAEALKTNATLIELNLADNRLGEAGVLALAGVLRTNTTLATLNLEHNNLDKVEKRWLGVINAYLARNRLLKDPTLTQLDLRNNQLGRAGVLVLAEVLRTNTTLATLGLRDNRLWEADMQALAEVLKTNTTLTTLDLTDNELDGAGVQALAEALKTNIALTTLYLDHNQVADVGAQALAEALKTNTALTSLYLGRNGGIADAGAQALAEALKTNTALTRLNLWDNNVRDAGVQALAEALKTNTTLIELNLEYNQLGEAGRAAKREIEGYLTRNRNRALQEAAKATSQPKDSKSAPSSVPPQDKKETKGESKTSASSEAIGVPSKSLSSIETVQPAAELSDVTASSAIVTMRTPPSPRSNPPVLPLEHKVEVETADVLPSSQSFTGLPASHAQFFYTAGGEVVNTPPSPQPFAGQSARHGQFFRSPSPRDEKEVMLLADVQQALDQAYPASVSEHSDTRQAYLTQLVEYQSRPGILSKSERDTLRELLTTLEQVVAQRAGKQADSPALS